MLGARDVTVPNLPEVEEGFIPIRLASLLVDTIAGFDIHIQLAPAKPCTLYCERNLAFSEDARQRLVDNGIDWVFIGTDQRREYERYLESHLGEILEDTSITVQEKSDILYTSAHSIVEDLIGAADVENGVRRTKDLVNHTVSSMLSDQIHLGHFLDVIAADYTIYTHSVNVTAYAVSLAQRTGYGDPASLRELANGALLHDVGKSLVDPAILQSTGPLSPKQWESVKGHPVFGYDLLFDTNALGEIALDIVLHHHEKLSGSGYPDHIMGNVISPFVRMVTIADIFDALTTERPFQPAISSYQALSLMNREFADDIDMGLFKAFVAMMGSPGAIQ